MRSDDVKTHRTDGSCDTSRDERLSHVRTAIQTVEDLAAKVVLLHDHKGHLHVFHFEQLDAAEQAFIRQTWAVNREPAVNVSFAPLGGGDARRIG